MTGPRESPHLRSAIVTGGAAGIGEGIARRLIADGFAVALVDRSENGVHTAESLGTCDTVRFFHCDVTRTQQLDRLLAEVSAWHSAPQVLVNNAGITRKIDFLNVSEEDWDAIFAVNTRATFLLLQRWARLPNAAGPRAAVNIASIGGKGWTRTSNIAYASSKGAVLTMTRVAARQLAPCGIRVNAVCPGLVDTSMLRGLIEQRADELGVPLSQVTAEYEGISSLGSLVSVDDIAAAVSFLVSDEARQITGQSLNVDGGILWD